MSARFRYLLAIFLILASLLICRSAEAVRYDPGDWVSFTMFKYVTSIAADNNVVYFGTTGGIIRYDRYARTWLDPLTTTSGLLSNYIQELAFDYQYNELWAVTDYGIAKYNITFESWTAESAFPSHLVVNDWNPARFTSLFTPFEYNYNEGYISDPNMRRYPITVGFEDEYDLMYVGTWGMGPGIIDTRHKDFEPIIYGPYNSNISRVIEIDEMLWMGNDYTRSERGITTYNRKTLEWNYFESEFIIGLDNAEITSGIHTDDYIWLGTLNGLIRVSNNNSFKTIRTFKGLPSNMVFSLAQYGGYLYVGTDNGIGILHLSGDVPDSSFKMPLADEFLLRGFQVNDMLEFKGTLYIATNDGVFSYNSDNLKFLKLDTPAADLAWGANDIFEDGKNLYFGARFGVVTVNPKTDTSLVATDHSLSSGWIINQVYGDKDNIWAATNIGLWRYRISDGYIYLYTVADGLPSDEINSLIIDGDYFWLGTRAGLIRFFWNDPGRGD
ncbi:MAG: hypothetical protein GY839_05800 [candidate division Zixibacteria bacterium]|nr:hypothetical protein [candidate division Zixibacteria bacterium]